MKHTDFFSAIAGSGVASSVVVHGLSHAVQARLIH